MLAKDDPHAVYTRVFEESLQRSGKLESVCLVALTVSQSPMGRYLRFAHIAVALRDAITWCIRHQIVGKKFIIREFSTWALLALLPLAFRCRHFVAFNINHNLVGRASRLALAIMGRFLDFYYFAGQDRFEQAPRHIKILDVSTAYSGPREASGTRHALVIWSKRADQFQPEGLDGLESMLQAQGIGVTMVGRPVIARLAPEAYIAGLSSCSDLVLAYHQGIDAVRHSGVIWDAILHGVPRIYVPDTLSFRNQVGARLTGRVFFYSCGKDLASIMRKV